MHFSSALGDELILIALGQAFACTQIASDAEALAMDAQSDHSLHSMSFVSSALLLLLFALK